MQKSKFLKLFALIELLSAILFLTLAVIFYVSKDAIGGDMTIPAVSDLSGYAPQLQYPYCLSWLKNKWQALCLKTDAGKTK